MRLHTRSGARRVCREERSSRVQTPVISLRVVRKSNTSQCTLAGMLRGSCLMKNLEFRSKTSTPKGMLAGTIILWRQYSLVLRELNHNPNLTGVSVGLRRGSPRGALVEDSRPHLLLHWNVSEGTLREDQPGLRPAITVAAMNTLRLTARDRHPVFGRVAAADYLQERTLFDLRKGWRSPGRITLACGILLML